MDKRSNLSGDCQLDFKTLPRTSAHLCLHTSFLDKTRSAEGRTVVLRTPPRPPGELLRSQLMRTSVRSTMLLRSTLFGRRCIAPVGACTFGRVCSAARLVLSRSDRPDSVRCPATGGGRAFATHFPATNQGEYSLVLAGFARLQYLDNSLERVI